MPTPAMGDWSIEVRSQSVAVFRPGLSESGSSDHVWDVPSGELPCLLAAVEQGCRIVELGRDFSWARRGVDGTLVAVPEIARPESVVLDGPISAAEFADFVRAGSSRVPEALLVEVARVLDADLPSLPVETAARLVDVAAGTRLNGRLVAALRAAADRWSMSAADALGESGGV